MRGVTAVAAREIGDRGQVLVAAAIAGLIPLAAPLLRGISSGSAAEARWMFATAIATGFVVAVGWAVVSGAVSAELSAGRMGFLFARPLSGPAIWAGKMAGAYAVVAASGLAVLAPTAAVSLATGTWPGGWPVGDVVAAVLMLAIGVTALAHPVAFLWRTRSLWLLADIAALVVVAPALAASLLTLVETGSAAVVTIALQATVAVLLAALLGSGAAQVVRGRCDVRAGHRALSLTLWGTAGAAAVVLASWVWWFVAVAPSDLTGVGTVAVSARGSWTAVSGPAAHRPGYQPTLLLDADSGRWLRVAHHPLYGWVAISDDGRRAAWLTFDLGLRRATAVLGVATLGPGKPTAVRTPMEELRFGARLAMAPSGDVAAIVEQDIVSVLSLPGLDILGSAHLPGEAAARWPAFLDDGTVVVLSFARDGDAPATALDVTTFAPSTRRLVHRATFTVASSERWRTGSRIHPGTGRMLAVAPADEGVALVLGDLLTGARLAVLERAERQVQVVRARFLADGRVVVAAQRDDGFHLLVFDPDGRPLLDGTLPAADAVGLGAEYVPGKVALTLTTGTGSGTARRVIGVDLATGESVAVGEGLRVATPALLWRSADIAQVIGPGSPASRLLTGDDGTLYLLEPATGALRPLT